MRTVGDYNGNRHPRSVCSLIQSLNGLALSKGGGAQNVGQREGYRYGAVLAYSLSGRGLQTYRYDVVDHIQVALAVRKGQSGSAREVHYLRAAGGHCRRKRRCSSLGLRCGSGS